MRKKFKTRYLLKVQSARSYITYLCTFCLNTKEWHTNSILIFDKALNNSDDKPNIHFVTYASDEKTMSNCNPGFMPRLLRCVSDSETECEEVTFSCAILSLIVTLLVILTILSVIYQTCLFIGDVRDSSTNHPKSKKD